MDAKRKNLLSFGFVREYCHRNNIEFPPEDVISLFALWLILGDRFDEDLSSEHIEFSTKYHDTYGEYQQITTDRWQAAMGKIICKKGDKQAWSFKLEGNKRIMLGILDVSKSAMIRDEHVQDFSSIPGGYGLFLHDMRKFYGSWELGYFEYSEQFNLKGDDVISMELDLTKEKGVLSFIFHSKLIDSALSNAISNVFIDTIDTSKQWRAACTIIINEVPVSFGILPAVCS